jgi:hypothetical protein
VVLAPVNLLSEDSGTAPTGPPPNTLLGSRTQPLAPPPTAADAWDVNSNAYQTWLSQQKASGVASGMIDPQTGWPTANALVDAARQYGGALIGGTVAPEGGAAMIGKWGDLAHDGLFRDHWQPGEPKIIDNRGVVAISRGLLPALSDSGVANPSIKYANTGSVYIQGMSTDKGIPMEIRFSSHAGDIKSGSAERPFGLVKQTPANPYPRMIYDIDTNAGPDAVRQKLNDLQDALKSAP